MKIFTKKIVIYILVGLITITGTFTSFYKGAYAFEYVGGALAFEEAIKWLLASVGIISAGGMTADYWENHSQEFEDYCTQQNITDTEVANWQLKLCEGILDKGSECWQAFKEWASTLTDTSSGGGGGTSVSALPRDVLNAFSNYYSNYNIVGIDTFNSLDGYNVYGAGSFVADGYVYTHLFLTDTTYYYQYSGFPYIYCNGNNTISDAWVRMNSSKTILMSIDNWTTRTGANYSNGSTWNVQDSPYHNITDVVTGSSDSDFISVQQDVTDLDIISSPIPDTDAQEVSIPMPGVADSDNEASAEAYDNIVDQVNDGTLELDDAVTQVIDTLKIIVYEQETEKIFPKPDNEEDQENLDDKINENKDNMGFTLGGLETVFPFCIPWDIYAFINLLRADPVPPKVELPFPNPLNPENPWTVEVDFSDWDDGMKIVRLAEDFLFIIGLAVLTRSLIGAGGGDG